MTDTNYTNLLQALKNAYWLGSTMGLLGWDEQVNLPPGSAEHRAGQSSYLADLHHRELTRPEVGEWLDGLEAMEDRLTDDQRTVVKWTRRNYDRARKLPTKFVMEKTEHRSHAYHAWALARQKDDFASYAPILEKTLELAREESSLLGWGDRPYDYHVDQHDPGLTSARIDDLFGQLQTPLVELVGTIIDSPRQADLTLFKGFEVGQQERFIRRMVERLGFDFNRGRLDRSIHPFCGGDGADTRMTTRFDPDNPLDAIFSSIHETGHGLYAQGLPVAERSNPLGKSVGMAVHESQSRLWENQVSRSRSFWAYFEPFLREAFPSELATISSEELYLAINAVQRNPIRVDSDEVTYNLHILLRFQLEKALFAGEISVRDLPGEWSRLSLDLIGLEPANDAEGVLQDIHWSGGSFGYFPSYCLGNMMAAQLWYSVLEEIPDLEQGFGRGDFQPLLTWLREKIHRHGRRYDTDEIVLHSTGQPLGPEALLRYLKERYLPLYR
jgi:carboxypeptidase Taq